MTLTKTYGIMIKIEKYTKIKKKNKQSIGTAPCTAFQMRSGSGDLYENNLIYLT